MRHGTAQVERAFPHGEHIAAIAIRASLHSLPADDKPILCAK